MFRSRKGQMLKVLAFIMLALVLAFFAYLIFTRIAGSSHRGVMSMTESLQCTDVDRARSPDDYLREIQRRGQETVDGEQNRRFSPEAAVEDFNTYLACRERTDYSVEDSMHEQIVNAARATYVSYAAQLCENYNEARSSTDDDRFDEMAELEEDYFELAQQYDEVFRISRDGEHMSAPQACAAWG